jgi:long-chain acyl-CoA synthetase
MDALISSTKTLFALRPVLTGTPTPLFGSFVLSPIQTFREHPAGFSELNAAFLRFTSGTTGASKGVILSHETIRERIAAANEVLNLGPQDRVVWLLSMSYHFAVSIVSYLSYGATILLCDGPFAADILTTAARHGGTVIYGSPVHYDLMAHAENAPALPHLRLAVSTTTALRAETAEAFAARFGRPLVQAYGIIEIGLPCINADRPGEKKTAVGKVLPAYQIRLRDVGAGAEGRAIQFRGPGLIDAYYEPFRRRDEIMPDGWFDTGDLGALDADGCLHILGRAKEMISVGGMKFFPQETEEVLAAHPAVAEACVFARADRRLGEIGAARVVLKKGVELPPDERELKDYCAQRLAAYKVPESIEFVDDLPRTASGKPLRRDLSAETATAKGTVR